MPTPAQIDEQIALERQQIRLGLKQLHDNQKKLEDKSYASASIYGVVSIEQLLPDIVDRITSTKSRLNKGEAGIQFAAIRQYLTGIEPEAAAAIALKVTFDKVFSTKQGSSLVTNVTAAIGQAIEQECLMRHYEDKVPGLLNAVKDEYFHRSIGTHQKVKVVTTLMNRYDVDHWTPWNRTLRARLGSWLLDCICQESGFFEKISARKGQFVIGVTEHFVKHKDEIIAQAELFSPLAWPMLVEPNDWDVRGKHGGYILNQVMRGYPMVRRGTGTRIQGKQPVEFLNKIQKVAYTLNPFIVNVAETLMERGRAVGKFIPIVEMPIPPKPADIDTNRDSEMSYRRAAAEAHNMNAQAFKRSCRTRMTMNAVDVFKNKEKFYIPWSFDYRGRAYPIPAFLTPQDTDFGKSLLKFHNHGPCLLYTSPSPRDS